MQMGAVATGQPGIITAGQLRSHAKFVRTEYVLGHVAYMLREEMNGYLYETYYAPEFSPFPLKKITYHGDYKWVDEPLSLTVGEPDAAQVSGPACPLDEVRAVIDNKLNDRILEKPEPLLPPSSRPDRRARTVL